MPGRFIVKSSANRDRRGIAHERDITGASAAAAEALSLALDAEAGYQIFAPQVVLDIIPTDMRCRDA